MKRFALLPLIALFALTGLAAAQDEIAFGKLSVEPPPATMPGYGYRAITTKPPGPAALGTRIPILDLFYWPPHFRHGDPDDPGRHVGLGYPLVGTSWRNRPFHIGWLVGRLYGDDLIDGRVSQDEGLLGGYRLGWDFDHYWGTELRYAFSHVDVDLPALGTSTRTSRVSFLDVNLTYYPWGDVQWRPYLSLGLGSSRFDFQDDLGQRNDQFLFTIPFGIGVKYYWQSWMALRMSLMDQWSFSGGNVDSMHNLSLTFGVEMRFGGFRRGYSY